MWKKIGLGILMIFGVIAAGYIFGKTISLTLMAMAVLFVINKKFVGSKFLNVCIIVAGLVAIGSYAWLRYSTEFPMTVDMLREQKRHLDISNAQKGFVGGNAQDSMLVGFAYRLSEYQRKRFAVELDSIETLYEFGTATSRDTARVDTLMALLAYNKDYTRRIANGQPGLGTPMPKLASLHTSVAKGTSTGDSSIVVDIKDEDGTKVAVPPGTEMRMTVDTAWYCLDFQIWTNPQTHTVTNTQDIWANANGYANNVGYVKRQDFLAPSLPPHCTMYRAGKGVWVPLGMGQTAVITNHDVVPLSVTIAVNDKVGGYKGNKGDLMLGYTFYPAP
jgi:hypothetical protein